MCRCYRISARQSELHTSQIILSEWASDCCEFTPERRLENLALPGSLDYTIRGFTLVYPVALDYTLGGFPSLSPVALGYTIGGLSHQLYTFTPQGDARQNPFKF